MSHLQFTQTFSEFGGRFDIDNSDLPPGEKEILHQLLDNLRVNMTNGFLRDIMPNAKGVYVDYIDSKEHNATANGLDFQAIGINYGLVLNLFKIAGMLLASEELFEDLEDQDNELYSIEELRPLFSESFEKIPGITLRSRPISEERTVIATIVARIAFYFIVGHELTHVLQHPRILATITNQDRITEFYSGQLFDDQQKLDLKTLELDADRNGALVSFWIAVLFYEMEDSPIEPYYPGPAYVWMVAVLTLLYSFEKAGKLYYPQKSSSHPNAYIRQSFCIQFIRTVLDDPDFAGYFQNNYKPDFNLTLSMNFEDIQFFFGQLGLERNPLMEQEYASLINNLRSIQTKY